jgi:cytochrome bd-I ubiquinol oxidase subunit X
MWYFTWILGLTMAILLAVVNAMWFEMQETNQSARSQGDPS